MLLNQINQLEKDKDVVAQAQAIAMLEAMPQLSFSVVTSLNNFLTDAQVFFLSFSTVFPSPPHSHTHEQGFFNFILCKFKFSYVA